MWPPLQATSHGSQAPRLYWRGRGVGGSTAINGQIAIRGVLDAFDDWAEAGLRAGHGRHVLPFFNRLEDDLAYGDRPYHGRGGPIPIYRAPSERWGPVDRALRDAALGLGYPWADDLNAPDAEGVCSYAISSRDGVRVSTNDGYLEPARAAARTSTSAARPWSTASSSTAAGRSASAPLPGGAEELRAPPGRAGGRCLPAPPILLRSGVGPGRSCAHMGIAVLKDLPVGVASSIIPSSASSSSCAPSSGPRTSTRGTPAAASSTAPASPAARSAT